MDLITNEGIDDFLLGGGGSVIEIEEDVEIVFHSLAEERSRALEVGDYQRRKLAVHFDAGSSSAIEDDGDTELLRAVSRQKFLALGFPGFRRRKRGGALFVKEEKGALLRFGLDAKTASGFGGDEADFGHLIKGTDSGGGGNPPQAADFSAGEEAGALAVEPAGDLRDKRSGELFVQKGFHIG